MNKRATPITFKIMHFTLSYLPRSIKISGFHTDFVVQGDTNGKVEFFPKPQCQKFRKEILGIMLTLDLYLVVISVKTTSRNYLDEEVLEDCERSLGNPWRVKKVLYLLQQESRQ